MSKREWRLFIEDILECIDKIYRYIADMQFAAFRDDSRTVDAVIRNLEIIGESARNIPKDKYSDIPWQDIVDFRNRITHGYFDISLEIVWRIIEQELPLLREKVKKILEMKSFR